MIALGYNEFFSSKNMSRYEAIKKQLVNEPKVWLVTGVTGFIGSNLQETLLQLDQTVIGLDDFSTGYQHNLDEVESDLTSSQWGRFTFIEGDIRNPEDCVKAARGVDYVLHQAALGYVLCSINDPATTSAVTKYVNELYAVVFARTYGFKSIGLCYFNVFGKRQNPDGAYAAVIPKWIAVMIKGEEVFINGDGKTSRDFCFIENTVQMNILAATALEQARNSVYNVAVGDRTTLNDLFGVVKNTLSNNSAPVDVKPIYREFRAGDVRHSQADISKAEEALGYVPKHNISQGLEVAMAWYVEALSK